MFALSPLVAAGTVLAFALAGSADARRLGRRGVTIENALRRAPHVAVGGVLMLLMLAGEACLLVRPGLGWYLPLLVEYLYVAVVEGVILAVFAFTFGLTITMARDAKRADWRNLLALATIVTLGVAIGISAMLRPIYRELRAEERDGVVLQTSGNSCAPASAANLLRALGEWHTERELAELFGTTDLGTSGAQVIYGLRRLGLDCRRNEPSMQAPLEYPAMLLVDGDFVGHAVTLLGPGDGGRWRVADPLTGMRLVDERVIRTEWHARSVTCRCPLAR